MKQLKQVLAEARLEGTEGPRKSRRHRRLKQLKQVLAEVRLEALKAEATEATAC